MIIDGRREQFIFLLCHSRVAIVQVQFGMLVVIKEVVIDYRRSARRSPAAGVLSSEPSCVLSVMLNHGSYLQAAQLEWGGGWECSSERRPSLQDLSSEIEV